MANSGSGRQIADANFQRFITWLASKSDEEFRQMTNRDGLLSRKEIVAECGIGSSALNQNPRIKDALSTKEAELRERGVLPIATRKQQDNPVAVDLSSSKAQSFDADRLRRLELENATLKAENQELKRQLEKFAVLRDVLSTTGRLPR